MLSQRMALILECLKSNNCKVHIVSHDSKARGKHLVQGILLLHMHTAASVDTLQHTHIHTQLVTARIFFFFTFVAS